METVEDKGVIRITRTPRLGLHPFCPPACVERATTEGGPHEEARTGGCAPGGARHSRRQRNGLGRACFGEWLEYTISDPAGDTLKISPGNAPTPAYLDIIGVAVTRHGTSFEFSVDLAARVPSQPVLVNGVNQYAWFWFLNTDPTTFPSGYPRPPSLTGDRPSQVETRCLHRSDSASTPLTYRRIVGAETIDDPASFGFRSNTRVYQGLPWTEGFSDPDGAPSTAPGTPGYFVAWPS